MQDPTIDIEHALGLTKNMARKIYHNANAHGFESDCKNIIASLKNAIMKLEYNIKHDPYKKYLASKN